MNTPTKLTVLRIFLTIVIILLLLFPFYTVGIQFPKILLGGIYVKTEYFIAGGFFIVAAFTDFLDGYLARKNREVTDLGKMLDAIADKLLVNPVLVVLAVQGFITPWIPVIIIFRDIVVDAIKMEAGRRGKVQAAISSGKIKTASMMVGLTFTFFYNLPFEMLGIRVADFLLYFATVMSVVSMIEYFKINKELILPSKEQNAEVI